MEDAQTIDGEFILRLAGASTVYLGQLAGELKIVANRNFAVRFGSWGDATKEVARQLEGGRQFEMIPAPALPQSHKSFARPARSKSAPGIA